MKLSNNKKPTKISIVDDHPIFRVGLRHALSDSSDLQIVAEAINGREMLRKIQVIEVNLVILDIMIENETIKNKNATYSYIDFKLLS